jgi:hypothetical protein
MKIFIKYENNKNILLNISKYQSIHSIIYEYFDKLRKGDSYDVLDDYFLEYNGLCLNKDFSIDKYEIKENSILNLNKRQKGGNFNNFFTFAMKNPILVFIVFIIAFIPMFLLPLGFLPTLSALIKTIISKGIESLSVYLVCKLGKPTIVKRLNLIVNFFKYFIFILMVYVIITFPLILLCITLKGQSIQDSPLKMCSPLKAGSLAGVILTSVFFLIYFCHRGFNYVLSPLIYLFKQFFITNVTLVPILEAFEKIFNKVKYIPVAFIPFIGSGIKGYIDFLEPMVEIIKKLFSGLKIVGCEAKLDAKFFKKMNLSFKLPDPCDLIKKCSPEGKSEAKKEEDEENNEEKEKKRKEKERDEIALKMMSRDNMDYYIFKKELPPLCKAEVNKCCSVDNFLVIGNSLFGFLSNPIIATVVQNSGIYMHYLLFTECFLDEAKYALEKDIEDLYTNENIIKKKPQMDEKIMEIDEKIEAINKMGTEYAIQTNQSYIRGNSLFKTIFKDLFLNAFCNFVSSSKSGFDIILELGDIKDFADMLKSGASTGVMVGIMYFITLIVLLICGLCGVF